MVFRFDRSISLSSPKKWFIQGVVSAILSIVRDNRLVLGIFLLCRLNHCYDIASLQEQAFFFQMNQTLKYDYVWFNFHCIIIVQTLFHLALALLLFFSCFFYLLIEVHKVLLNPFFSSELVPLLSVMTCIVVVFHPLPLSIVVKYPYDDFITMIAQISSLIGILLSKTCSSILPPIFSATVHVILIHCGYADEHLLSHHLLLYLVEVPSKYIAIWEIVISICIWKWIPLHIISLILILWLTIMKNQFHLISVYSFAITIMITIDSLYTTMSLRLSNVILLLGFLTILQYSHPTWNWILLFLTMIPQSELSLLNVVALNVSVMVVSGLLFRNAVTSKAVPVVVANLIIFLSFSILVIGLLYSLTPERRLFGMSERLYDEFSEMISYLNHHGISNYYLNNDDLCFNEEGLYYYMLGLSYEYILITPFDKEIICSSIQPFYASLHEKDCGYLTKVFVSSYQSFQLYHIVQ